MGSDLTGLLHNQSLRNKNVLRWLQSMGSWHRWDDFWVTLLHDYVLDIYLLWGVCALWIHLRSNYIHFILYREIEFDNSLRWRTWRACKHYRDHSVSVPSDLRLLCGPLSDRNIWANWVLFRNRGHNNHRYWQYVYQKVYKERTIYELASQKVFMNYWYKILR
jgi:hypothetical protein